MSRDSLPFVAAAAEISAGVSCEDAHNGRGT